MANLRAVPITGACGLPVAEPLTSTLAAHAQCLADVAPARACPALATHLPGDRCLRYSEPFAQFVALRSETSELDTLPLPARPPSRRPCRHRRAASRRTSCQTRRRCRRRNRPVAGRKQRGDLVPRDLLRRARPACRRPLLPPPPCLAHRGSSYSVGIMLARATDNHGC